MPGRHNKATARDDYPTASRLGIIKPPWPQGRGRPWSLGRYRGLSRGEPDGADCPNLAVILPALPLPCRD